MVQTFFKKCIDPFATPAFISEDKEDISDEFEIIPENKTSSGQLGRVLSWHHVVLLLAIVMDIHFIMHCKLGKYRRNH